VKLKEYTIKQASEILEVSTSTIRRRIKSGEYVAEKKNSPYGEQYFIPAKEIDQAVMENESVNISQINKPVDKDEFVNALIEATEDKYRALFERVAERITKKIDEQNEVIEDYKEEIKGLRTKSDEIGKQNREDKKEIINKLDKQQEIIEQQSKMIQQLQKEKSESLLDKIKKVFGI